jgi:hypothetical protein
MIFRISGPLVQRDALQIRDRVRAQWPREGHSE